MREDRIEQNERQKPNQNDSSKECKKYIDITAYNIVERIGLHKLIGDRKHDEKHAHEGEDKEDPFEYKFIE